MFSFQTTGSLDKTRAWLNKVMNGGLTSSFNAYGQVGVQALESATPKETGETAFSWDYRVVRTAKGAKIEWFNTHVENGVNIAVILQYGHGTGTGGYVQGIDYINPAMRPVFEAIVVDLIKEVSP
jgi:hypothetical protein